MRKLWDLVTRERWAFVIAQVAYMILCGSLAISLKLNAIYIFWFVTAIVLDYLWSRHAKRRQ